MKYRIAIGFFWEATFIELRKNLEILEHVPY